MSNLKKSIAELNLIEDFLFTEASVDKKTSELLMRLIIERAARVKVGRLIIEPQKIINGVDTDCHGIRLDVSVREVTEEDGKTIQLFDIEPNNVPKVHLPKRSRFYQALTDVKLLETGVDYDKLPDMWTIWILPYDPFGMDYMLYSVKNMLEEFPEIEYNDGVRKLFLYTGGTKGGTEALKNLLNYIQISIEANAVDDDLKRLHSNVERLKSSKEIGVKYMQMQEVIKYKVEEELEEAVKEALEGLREEVTQKVTDEVTQKVTDEVTQKVTDEVTQKVTDEVTQKVTDEVTQKVTAEVESKMARLMGILLNEKRYDALMLATEDKQYRKKLMEEYHI